MHKGPKPQLNSASRPIEIPLQFLHRSVLPLLGLLQQAAIKVVLVAVMHPSFRSIFSLYLSQTDDGVSNSHRLTKTAIIQNNPAIGIPSIDVRNVRFRPGPALYRNTTRATWG